MGNRNNQLDVTHALTAHLLFCHLNTAAVTHNPLVTDALIFSAMALIILHRSEDTLTEQAVAFRLVCAVVDGLRLENLA